MNTLLTTLGLAFLVASYAVLVLGFYKADKILKEAAHESKLFSLVANGDARDEVKHHVLVFLALFAFGMLLLYKG